MIYDRCHQRLSSSVELKIIGNLFGLASFKPTCMMDDELSCLLCQNSRNNGGERDVSLLTRS